MTSERPFPGGTETGTASGETAAAGAATAVRGDVPGGVAAEDPGHSAGTRGFRRISAALWFAGAGTFMLLYCAQALLPSFAAAFDVSPAVSSLTLSATTGALALGIVPISAVAESWGRKRMMTVSLTASAVLGLVAPLAPSFEVLLTVRALQGLAMAGLPALAMAHLSREVHGASLGKAMGLLIAGNTMGGLSGRLVGGVVADLAGWRWALAVVGVLSFGCLVAFRMLVPPPVVEEKPGGTPWRVLRAQFLGHLADPGVRRVCLVSFVMMSAFVTVYNYLGFRLLAEPFGLPQALVGLIFLAYLSGTVSSTVAGTLGDRCGRIEVLMAAILLAGVAIALTLPDVLPLILLALVLFTVGFFAAHSVASGWLSQRATAAPAQASAMYLFCYYFGSSVGGTSGGVAYEQGGWSGVVLFVAALLAVSLACAVLLKGVPSRAEAQGFARAEQG